MEHDQVLLHHHCTIEIIQDEQLQEHIILPGMVPFGSNMFTTDSRIQPLKANVARFSESVASVISKSQIKVKTSLHHDFLKFSEKNTP